ncbi:MAG: divergent polysaccharide deacetylase family protein [Rhodospirillales bacterium]|nr:divergent polysaccharide deacetylase family protein [Rhodospirillales bacterium]MCB9965921.1 divergent polysaccharide deacetylase family protein [Rhodospirillales bacterium]
MPKKQVSIHLALYLLCGLLLSGLAMSYLLRSPSPREETPEHTIAHTSQKAQNSGTVHPSDIQNPEVMATLKIQAQELEAYLQTAPEDPFFDNPFSAFYGMGDVGDMEEADGLPALPKIAIIIDDMGINQEWSRKASELPSPVTLSFLPYAENLQQQADFAKEHGHQLMLHMPMEAVGGVLNKTPGLLRHDDPDDLFQEKLTRNIESFEGFTGINNHMGSRLTQDRASMTRIMAALKPHHLYFVDSRTIHNSIAADSAEKAGVPTLTRDIFLDHEETMEYTAAALADLEEKARKDGIAIAIGHPKEITITALADWIPTLKDKGFTLVSADDLIVQKYPLAQIVPYHHAVAPVQLSGINSQTTHKAAATTID